MKYISVLKVLVATFAVTLLALTGCTITYGPPRIINETVDAPDAGSVSVVASTGSVEIAGASNSSVDITATVRETTWPVLWGTRTPAEAIELDIDTSDGVTISHMPFETRGISVSYDVLVPLGTAVGDVVSETGSITIQNVAGNPVLQTSTGSVTATGVAGTVVATSSTGSLNIRNANAVGPLTSRTGSITADIRDLAPGLGSVSVSTSTGSIRLYIDPDLALTIRAETGTGSISVHDDLQVVVTNSATGVLDGTMNGGGDTLSVHTSTGSISIYPLD